MKINMKKDKSILIRLTVEENNLIRQKAADCGYNRNVSEYIRSCALGRKTRRRIHDQIINELRKLGGLQKHLFMQGDGQNSKAYSDILQEIKLSISRIATIDDEDL